MLMMNVVKTLCLGLLGIVIAFPQSTTTSVNQSDGPPSGSAIQTVFIYSGSTVIAQCWSPSRPTKLLPRTATVAISTISKASAAIVTSTGHGLSLLTRPSVILSGATGTGWTGVNATWTATVLSADTFSIPIDSSGFGTLGGTIVFTTTAPRQTVAEWSVQLFLGSPISSKAWLGGSQSFGSKCSDVTSTTVILQ